MYAEDYCSSAIRSSLFGSNSSRLLLSAVKDRVIFTSVLHLTAGTWFCWGLQWQGLRLEGTGAIMAFVAVLLAASLQAWSVASKCIRVCVKVGLRGASLALVVVVWRGRCSDLFVLVCATGKGPGKCKAGKMPMLPGEMSLPSQDGVVLVNCSGCPSSHWHCFCLPWFDCNYCSFTTWTLTFSRLNLHQAGFAGVLQCWAKHSIVKMPHTSAGQHLQELIQ